MRARTQVLGAQHTCRSNHALCKSSRLRRVELSRSQTSPRGPLCTRIRPGRRPAPRRRDSQDEQPVALPAVVAVGLPGFDLQPLGVRALRAVQRLQQARRAQVHRVEGTQPQAENLAVLFVALGLQRAGRGDESARVPCGRVACASPSPLLAPGDRRCPDTRARPVRPGPAPHGEQVVWREGQGRGREPGRDEAFTSVSCCFLSPPFQRISSRLPSSGQLVGPGREVAGCASPRCVGARRGTSRGRGGARPVDGTDLGGCPRRHSCCRKAARARLELMGELMAQG